MTLASRLRPFLPLTCRSRLKLLLGLVAALAGLALSWPERSGGQSPGERLTSRPRSPAPPVKTIAVGDEIATDSGQRQRLGLPDGSVLYVNANTRAILETPRRLKLTRGEVFLEDGAQPRPKSEDVFVIQTPQRTVSSRGAALAVRLGKADTTVLVTRGQATVTGLEGLVRAGEQLRGTKPETAQRASDALAWTRDLRIAADLPLVPASKHAGGALIVRDPNGQEASLTLRKFHIDVHVEDGFARTTIDQTYFNDSPSQLEGTFYFPLPADASLSRLAMYVEGEGGFCQLMEGGMVEANLGRRVYEDIRYANRDPALLEWLDGSTFKMRVFPIEGRKEKRLLLSYTQRLDSLYGRATYRFPAGHTLQTVRDWSFHARVKGGAAVAHASPSHTLKATREGKDLLLDVTAKKARVDRDVVLLLTDPRAAERETARFSTAEHEGARYLMLSYRPELATAAQPGRRDWVFLFESSGDRDPVLARVQIDLIRHLLAQADPEDTFTVLAAGTRVRYVFGNTPRKVRPKDVQATLARLERAHLVGALDLGKALAEAGTCLKESKNPYLVHVGSGIAAMGERRLDALVSRLPAGTRYVGIGVGRRWNRSFMKAAAERTGGLFTQVNPDEPVGWRAFELFATLNTPRLLNVTVADADSGRALLCHATALAQGEEVCAVTRLEAKEEMPKSLVVRGSVAGTPYERVLAARDATPQADYLPRTWAKLEIERLLAENAVKHRPKIIELSKAMYVMTPFTSLLVLENDDLYTQYKADRGRKDHWAMYSAPAKIAVVYEPDPDQIDPKLLRSGAKLPRRHVLKSIVIRPRVGILTGESGSTRPWLTGIDYEDFHARNSLPLGSRLEGKSGQQFDFYKDAAGRTLAVEMPTDNLASQQPRIIALDGPKVFSYGGLPGDGGTIVNGRVEEASARLRALEQFNRLRTLELRLTESLQRKDLDPNNPAIEEAVRLSRVRRQMERLNAVAEDRKQYFLDSLDDAEAQGKPPVVTAGLPALPSSSSGVLGSIVLNGDSSNADVDRFVSRVVGGSTSPPSLLYQRPFYREDPLLFADLVRYAPGLNTSEADIRAVLQAEAIPHPADRPGKVSPEARKLLDDARVPGWTRWTIERKEAEPPLTLFFDGKGRYAYERVLSPGLKERVVCDGKTLLHLYPQLGLAARRTVSRFHRADLADLVPWALPPADDLAHGADVKVLRERTVAIIPRGAETAKDSKGKPVPYARIQLLFGEDGRLAERQVVRMPRSEVLLRQVCTPEGVVRLLDAKGKELAVRKGTLAPAKGPNLKVKTSDLVVLPLPYRTTDHVRRTLKLEKKDVTALRFDEGLPLLTAAFAQGNSSEAYNLFRQVFHRREQRQLGFYVLLAACGMNLDAQNADVLAEHLDEPVAQYLALHSSPVLRKHASQWAVGSGQWGEGFLQHLAVSHALYQRWQNAKILKGNLARVKADVQRGLDYVRRHTGTAWGWTLLCLMQDRAGEVKALHPLLQDNSLHASLAECFALFEQVPGLRYAARYEQARCLLRAGKQGEGRKLFEQLYADTLKEERLPAIDGDFRLALLGRAPEADHWNALLRSTATRLVESKRRPAVLALAWQCWQLDDRPLANSLLARALHGIKEDKERLGMSLAGIQFLWQTGQLPQTDKLLQEVLAHKEWGQQAALWRLAAALAERRDQSARALECLEMALALEYAKLPEVIDLQAVRRDYGKLLGHYQNLADAMVTLKVQQPADFMARAVAAADRWRALDREPGAACQAVARILQRLDQHDLGWDYLTTPVGLRPNEAGPWLELAESLGHRGELQLADRAYAAAYEAEPTNAQILWDRAQNLRALGRSVEAVRLLRQIAEGRWHPRFQGVQALARIQTGRE
jgi:ferric-dicitrate binding protein FerR (iron transport regulator)